MALKGTNATISVSTDDVTYTAVAEMHQASIKINGNNIDITHFGDTFVRRFQGIKDWSISMSGFFKPTDTNGQIAIQSALLSDTTLYAKITYNGTNGFKNEVKVNSFDISDAVAGTQDLSIELVGAGGGLTTV